MENGKLSDHLTTLMLRLPVGLLFLMAGIGKLTSGESFATNIHSQYDNSFLGGPLLSAFILVLPFAETVVGLLLVLGLFTSPALIGAGMTLIVLFFGKLVAHDGATSAQIMFYLFIVVLALRGAEQNQFSLDAVMTRSKRP
jgi:thiosulfate dehydrogenase [quinone] large subunit